MDIRYLTHNLAVSPQISVEDVAAVARNGFTKIVCNRPDSEVPEALQADAIRSEAESLGLDFEIRPLTRETLSAAVAAEQRQSVEESQGKVLAYCASGTRCTLLWAIGEQGHQSDEDIIRIASDAGYDLAPLWGIVASAKG